MKTNLHIITQPIIPDTILASSESHGLLLLREAVYLLLQPFAINLKVYVLEEDLLARGLQSEVLPANVELIDYKRFVDLTIEYKTSTSW